MKRLLIALLIAVGLATSAWQVEAQGSLSNQVLRLLTRTNSWSGINTFTHAVGIAVERGTAPSITTDTIYNVGGNLYFNGSVLATNSSAGTVTSVALTAPAILSVAGSPITSSGTLALTLATQNANIVFAGPTTGGAATPTFRSLVAADIPDISAIYLTASSTATLTNKSGNISQWTNNSNYITNSVATLSSLTSIGTIGTGVWQGTVVAGLYGGTGVANSGRTITLGGNVTTAAAFITSGANSLTLTTTGSTNVTLPTSGTLLTNSVTTLSSLVSIGTITTGGWNGTAIGVAYGGTNITSYAVGDLLYASGSTTLSKLADVATGNALISGGVTTAPSWGKIGLTTHVSGTLPLANGGTGVTTSADDTVLIGSGAAWVAKTLTSGVQSYDATTNSFSVPTTFILGTGAPTASANNILLRSNTNQVLEVMEGNAADYADLIVRRASIGGSTSSLGVYQFTSPVSGNTANDIFDVTSALAAGTAGQDYIGTYSNFAPAASTNITGKVYGNLTLARPGSSETHTFAAWYGGYFAAYQQSSGTTTLQVALAADAQAGGSRTTTTNIGLDVLAKGTGTSAVTDNIGIRIQTPLKGSTMTNTYGIYIADQTLAATTIDYAFIYAAPSSKEFIIKTAGDVFIKDLMTTGSAGSKKVVCVDTATGKLYASSTSTDCSN